MQKWSSKSESTWKTEQDKFCWKFFTLVKVNNQRSGQSQRLDQRLGILTWQCDVTLGLTWQYVKEAGAWRLCSWHIRLVWETDGAWRPMLVRQKLQAARGGSCEVVSGSSLLGFARDRNICQSVLWLWQFDQQNWWNPSVLGVVGITAVTHFWQWLLDEGKSSGRTPEMSTGTRKSEEWL